MLMNTIKRGVVCMHRKFEPGTNAAQVVYSMKKPAICILALLLVIATCSFPCRAQLTITVRSYELEYGFLNGFSFENSTVLRTYNFPSGLEYPLDWFVAPYASIPAGGITGLLFQPQPTNACGPVSLRQLDRQVFNTSLMGNATGAIAIVEDYHLCIERKIENLKAAGFDAVITYNINDTSGFNQNVNSKVYDRSQGETFDVIATEYPISIVSESFARYLIQNATINSNLGSDTTIVFLHIEADSTSQGWIQIGIGAFLVVVFIGIPLLLCVCLLCCCCNCCLGTKCERWRDSCDSCQCTCRCRKNRSGIMYDVHEFEIRILGDNLTSGDSQQNGTQTDNQNGIGAGRFCRTFESGSKAPLFREFKLGDEICTSCAICLEDFTDGEKIHSLPCDQNHIFHPKCINQWLKSQNVCPVCRTFLTNPPF